MFRLALITLLVLFASATSATDANTQAYYKFDGDATDSKNSNDLTENGTVNYDSVTCLVEGTQNAVLDSSTDYFSLTGGFVDSMAGDTSWTVEGYVYFSSLAGDPFPFEVYKATGDYVALRVISTGVIRMIVDDTANNSSAGLVTSGVCYFYFFSYDGTTLKAGFSPAATPDATADHEWVTANAEWPATGSTMHLGRHVPSGIGYVNGNMDGVEISDVTRTTFPTTTGETTTGSLSPYKFGGTDRTPYKFPKEWSWDE